MHPQILAPNESAGSAIVPPGRLGDARRTWQPILQAIRGAQGLRGGIQGVEDQLNALKFIARRLVACHPFQVYSLPGVLRASPNPAADWRKFRVRAGKYLDTDVSGTDGNDVDPDGEAMAEVDVADIMVASGKAAWWFWIDASNAGSPTVQNAETPPDFDSTHIPIAVVDTSTNAAQYSPVIRQILRADVVSVGGGGVKQFKIDVINADTIACYAWDGSQETGSTVTIAKPPKLRGSLTSETIDSVAMTYSSYSNSYNYRVASDGTNTQSECIYPRYKVGDIVYAAESDGGTGISNVTKLEVCPARVWARQYVQPS